MVEIAPFRGLRYDASVVGDLARVIAPPYDVVSPAMQDALYERSPFNVIRLELTKQEPGADRYRAAAAALDDWRARGALRRDDRPAFYPADHAFSFRGRPLRRRGFFCALRLYAWDRGAVLPHERTFSGPKADRLQLLRATRVNTSPVFALYDDGDGAVARILDGAMRRAEVAADATTEDEREIVARLDDASAARRLAAAFADRRLYVADGHHRYETALQYANERDAPPDDPARFTLAYLVALQDPGLLILPTHRIVRGADEALSRAARASFDAAAVDAGALEDQSPPIVLARGGRLEALTPRRDADLGALPASWRSLPVAQAEHLLVEPARRAGAEVTYTHDLAAALDAAERGATAILLRGVDAETLRRVADAGERLPQKTTYFHPKVPTGLVLRALD